MTEVSALKQIAVGKEMLYVSRAEVEQAAPSMEELFEIVEDALGLHGRGQCEMPPKIGLHPQTNTLMHAMPAFLPGRNGCGIKWAACFPENHRQGLPQTSGLIIVNDPSTGFPISVMDATWITAKRTAVVTAVACKFLARRESEQLGIIGAGVQGEQHIQVLPRVLPNLKRVLVYDNREHVRDDFVRRFDPSMDFAVEPASGYREAVEGSDVVVTATTILEKPNPRIWDAWIARGAFLAPVDFDSLWEFRTMERVDKFLVDSIDEMRYFTTIGYLPSGLPTVYAELGEVVCGEKRGRESEDETIMDMNIGMAVEDVPLAREILERVVTRGLGVVLPL